MTNSPMPDLAAAKAVLDLAHDVVDRATAALAAGSIDEHQVLAYDLAHAAAAVGTGRAMLDYGEQGRRRGGAWPAPSSPTPSPTWPPSSTAARPSWGVDAGAARRGPRRSSAAYRDPAFLAALAADEGPRHLDADFELVQDTFRRFAEDKIRPGRRARPPRTTTTSPRTSSTGLAEMGGVRPVGARASTAATARAARASTSAWSWPPRSCRAARSASAARSSPGPRS